MIEKLAVGATIKEGIGIGARNTGPILANVLFWLATIWIPYLNVGTTIGLTAGIVAKASRGEPIPFTEVFNPKYRKYMGEYFLVAGLILIGVSTGLAFAIIPGIVISMAWCLAILLVVDKGKNPSEAITMSNDRTYGNKARIAAIHFLVIALFTAVQMIIWGMGYAGNMDRVVLVSTLIVCASVVFEVLALLGIQASIYRQLGTC